MWRGSPRSCIVLTSLVQHDGKPPQTYAEKKEFKTTVQAMKKKFDEENFDEAEAQAYRCWSETGVPSEVSALFDAPELSSVTASSPPFFILLDALKKFVAQPPHVLPLSAALPDMKASTGSYIELQKLYKARAQEEKESGIPTSPPPREGSARTGRTMWPRRKCRVGCGSEGLVYSIFLDVNRALILPRNIPGRYRCHALTTSAMQLSWSG